MKLPHLLTAVAVTLFSTALAIAPAVAQNRPSYTYIAPSPGSLADSGNSAERLATDREVVVYGGWDFTYARTPDDNLFVTRIFISASRENLNTLGSSLQIDCGRGMFRHFSSPLFFRNGRTPGSRLNVGINEWLGINRNFPVGQAMMRTCEAVARQEEIEWSWFAR